MNQLCYFVSDLHGRSGKYRRLLAQIRQGMPAGVFLGGDLLPSGSLFGKPEPGLPDDFARDFLAASFMELKKQMGSRYPEVFLIMGNDDPRREEPAFLEGEQAGLWHYVHGRKLAFGPWQVYGYSYVPPTPFQLKDWERYDVSRYVDPGCVPPTQGYRSVPAEGDVAYDTIREDLEQLSLNGPMEHAIFLFHSPPYGTMLDRAALEGVMHDHVPADPHVGSTAIRAFIEARQPLLTLHGHIHESSTLTGAWKQSLGRTWAFSAAWEGHGLALVQFRLNALNQAQRRIL